MLRIRLLTAAALVACGVMVGCTKPAPAAPAPAGPQVPTTSEEVRMIAKDRYLLYLPEEHGQSGGPWPLVLFLHGAGEGGDDLELVKKNGPPKLIAAGKEFPFILVAPQCPSDVWWTGELGFLKALLDSVVAEHDVDEERVYVTGLSMGGYGTWALAMEQPDRFAAIAPICGRGDPERVSLIKHLPIWVFHGAQDNTVPLEASEKMVEALRAAGTEPKFTVYPEAGHDSWTATYDNPEFYEWLLAQRRRPSP